MKPYMSLSDTQNTSPTTPALRNIMATLTAEVTQLLCIAVADLSCFCLTSQHQIKKDKGGGKVELNERDA